MPEEGDFELFTGPAPSEKKEMSDEKFREEMKRTQQQLKQLQKEEGQAQMQDNNLAQIIIRFLSQPENTDLFLLISRTVAQDIPSEFILAVLSLTDERASKEVKGYLESSEKAELAESKALAIPETSDFKALPPEHKKALDEWIKTIYEVGTKKPHRVLEGLVIIRKAKESEEGNTVREISAPLVQLSAFILRNYLNRHKVAHEFEPLKDFMQGVFVALIKKLEEQVEEQKRIK